MKRQTKYKRINTIDFKEKKKTKHKEFFLFIYLVDQVQHQRIHRRMIGTQVLLLLLVHSNSNLKEDVEESDG